MHTTNGNTLHTIQKRVGYAAGGACGALALLNLLTGIVGEGRPFTEILAEPAVFVVLALGIAALLSTFWDSRVLRVLHVSVFVGYSYVASLLIEPGSLHGALFGVYGVILCLQYGFLKRHFWPKLGLILAVYSGVNIYQASQNQGITFHTTPGTAILIAMFVYLFWVAFAEEIKEYTQENTALKEERDKNKVFVRFGQSIAGVVHNLKSALMSVDGYIDLLQICDSEEKEDLLQLQRRSTTTMLEMINNFMGAVKSYQHTEIEETSLNELVRSSIEVLRGNLRLKHRLKITVKNGEPDVIRAVPMEVMQVIDNIVTNASEAMQEGEGYRLTLETEPAGDFVRLSVQDEGPGIGFCCGCDARNCLSCTNFGFGKTTKPQGSGVGMMCVRQILKESKGRLEITSDESKGTRVDLYFPTGSV